MSLKVNV